MLDFISRFVDRAEQSAKISATACLPDLRMMPFDDFGEFMISLPNAAYPNISAALPAMASTEVQQNWTGGSGLGLLRQTNGFLRVVSQYYSIITKNSLEHARVLDFGCGYGRMMRGMYYFANPRNIYGCDPWDQSINQCKADRVLGQLAVSDYLPEQLPFTGKFDLIYAFSVFTHLSKRATAQCLNTLANSLAPGGVLAITIRPLEYWGPNTNLDPQILEDMTQLHKAEGFAFNPHNRAPVDGDVTYGDTSMEISYLRRNFPMLAVEKIERTMDDWSQTIIFLTLKD